MEGMEELDDGEYQALWDEIKKKKASEFLLTIIHRKRFLKKREAATVVQKHMKGWNGLKLAERKRREKVLVDVLRAKIEKNEHQINFGDMAERIQRLYVKKIKLKNQAREQRR